MKNRLIQTLRNVITVGVVSGCVAAVAAVGNAGMVATITVDKTTDGSGWFRYEYLIENAPTSDVTVNAFVLDVGDGADLRALEAPGGWTGDYDPAEDPFELAFVSELSQSDIQIGSHATFAFTSPLDEALLPYFVANLNFETGEDHGSFFGDIASPSVKPKPPLLGDVNLDSIVNGLDVNPFVDVLLNGTDDNATKVRADMNQDGTVNGLDVDPFVAAVVGGGTHQIPEPSNLLLCIVALAVVGGLRNCAGDRSALRCTSDRPESVRPGDGAQRSCTTLPR